MARTKGAADKKKRTWRVETNTEKETKKQKKIAEEREKLKRAGVRSITSIFSKLSNADDVDEPNDAPVDVDNAVLDSDAPNRSTDGPAEEASRSKNTNGNGNEDRKMPAEDDCDSDLPPNNEDPGSTDATTIADRGFTLKAASVVNPPQVISTIN